MRFVFLAAIFISALLSYFFWPKANLDAIFPVANGREAFLSRCGSCHSPELFLFYREQGRKDVAGLLLTMQKLYGMGALNPEEEKDIQGYLKFLLTLKTNDQQ